MNFSANNNSRSAAGCEALTAAVPGGSARRSRVCDHSRGPFRRLWLLLILLLTLFCLNASAQTNLATGFGPVQITLGSNNGPQDVDSGIKILFFITLLTLAPSILLLMTCFTRVVIVLSFVRTALQLQGTPANQIIIGLSLFIT